MPASEVMHEFKTGSLRSGSKHGPVVTSRPQAIAIMLSEKRAQGEDVPSSKDASDALQRRRKAGYKGSE